MWYCSSIMLTNNTIINKGRIFMKRKILSLFLCSVMLVGCKNQGEIKTSSKSDNDSKSEIQIVSDKEDLSESQSFDKSLDFLKKMKFHEMPISFPCKFKDLSDNFTLGNGFYFSETDYTFYDLLYQGNKVASVGIDGEKTEQNNDKEVVVLIIEDEQLANLKIDGASCDVDIDTMIDRLGEPYNKSVGDWKSLVEYISDSVDVAIVFNDNQTNEIMFVKKSK